MAAESFTAEHTWRCLWSRAAYDIICSVPTTTRCEHVQIGAGWGFRSCANHERVLLLHPSGNGRATGDLALTVRGRGTQVIPRCSYSYPEYLDEVADIIKTASRAYLELPTPDTAD